MQGLSPKSSLSSGRSAQAPQPAFQSGSPGNSSRKRKLSFCPAELLFAPTVRCPVAGKENFFEVFPSLGGTLSYPLLRTGNPPAVEKTHHYAQNLPSGAEVFQPLGGRCKGLGELLAPLACEPFLPARKESPRSLGLKPAAKTNNKKIFPNFQIFSWPPIIPTIPSGWIARKISTCILCIQDGTTAHHDDVLR